jgi:GTP:adenosylcobinamide-phosphate guanylyltransferase
MVNALVLAGCGPRDKDDKGLSNKPFIMINGKPMIEYVIDALSRAAMVDRISVVGPRPLLERFIKDRVAYIIDQSKSIFDNLNRGIQPFKEDGRVLVATSDIPMITPGAVDHFISKSQQSAADLCYPIVSKDINEQKFPGTRRTYVKLKEGVFTGGNMMYLNPRMISTCGEFAKKLLEYRKRPLKTSRLIGFSFLVRFLLGMLSISKLEERVSTMLAYKVAAVISPYPEIGTDVDRAEDIELAKRYLQRLNIGA